MPIIKYKREKVKKLYLRWLNWDQKLQFDEIKTELLNPRAEKTHYG